MEGKWEKIKLDDDWYVTREEFEKICSLFERLNRAFENLSDDQLLALRQAKVIDITKMCDEGDIE